MVEEGVAINQIYANEFSIKGVFKVTTTIVLVHFTCNHLSISTVNLIYVHSVFPRINFVVFND